MTTNDSITAYANAGYPAVAIATADEDRSISSITAALMNGKRAICKIAATGGLVDVRTKAVIEPGASFAVAFDRAANEQETLLIVLDFQHIIRNAAAYRSLRNSLNKCKENASMIVLVGPAWTLPPELEHDIPVLRDSLPSREELSAALNVCVQSVDGTPVDDATRRAILDAASGLTLGEAEGAMALSFDGQTFAAPRVLEEKMKIVRQSGHLEVSPAANPSELGGLDGLRQYLTQEVLPNASDPDLQVRGILLVGVPGTGKSLAARVAGGMLGWPVLRCDIAALKGSHVGQSEQAMRAALRLAEAVAPCVLFFDELEKAVGGYASSAQTDSGVTLGMVGALLTWLQEHKSPIFTIGTVNDYSKLPAELTRAGRFDERFFVDLPTQAERVDIGMVHLRRFGAKAAAIPSLAEAIATLANGWTGAEIEQLVRSAARQTRRAFTVEALTEAARHIKPISTVRATEISALRQWGSSNLRAANSPETPVTNGRKISRSPATAAANGK